MDNEFSESEKEYENEDIKPFVVVSDLFRKHTKEFEKESIEISKWNRIITASYISKLPVDNFTEKCFHVIGKDIEGQRFLKSANATSQLVSVFNSRSLSMILKKSMIEIRHEFPKMFYPTLKESVTKSGVSTADLLDLSYFRGSDCVIERKLKTLDKNIMNVREHILDGRFEKKNIGSENLCNYNRYLKQYNLCHRNMNVDENKNLDSFSPEYVILWKKKKKMYIEKENKFSKLRNNMEDFGRQFTLSYFLYRCIDDMRNGKNCQSILQNKFNHSRVYNDIVDTQNLAFWVLGILQKDIDFDLVILPEFNSFLDRNEGFLLEEISKHCLPKLICLLALSSNPSLKKTFDFDSNIHSMLCGEGFIPNQINNWTKDMENVKLQIYNLMHKKGIYSSVIHNSWTNIRPLSVEMLMKTLQNTNCFMELRRLTAVFGHSSSFPKYPHLNLLKICLTSNRVP